MPFDYDLIRNTGRPTQLLPTLRQGLREAGFDLHPGEGEILVRHEVAGVGRVQAKLYLVPPQAAVLRAEIPVTSIPSPPSDAFYLALAHWNASTDQLRAHTVDSDDDQVRVVISASLLPNQEERDAFSTAEIRELLDRMLQAKSGLLAAISG